MKRNKRRILSFLFVVINLIFITTNVYAHSGKTDSSGGHKDNKNKSGLGSYHYHCGGYPAHLHTNGVCPYSSSSKSSKSSSSSSTSSSSKSASSSTTRKTSEATSTIEATEIKINETGEILEVGKSKILTATITPDNVTDKSITWKSSDENIATVSANGEAVAKKAGTVAIIASTSNGKTNTIKMIIKEKEELGNTNVVNTVDANQTNSINSNTTNNVEESNPIGGLLTLGLLGGFGYLGYKKYKKSNKTGN